MHVSKEEEEAAHGVPQPGVGQGLLVAHAGALDHLGQGVEDLAGHPDGLGQVGLAGRVDDFLARVVPVKVHHGLLEAEQVVDRADDQVDRRRVASLAPQVVLPVDVVALGRQLKEPVKKQNLCLINRLTNRSM